MRKITNVLTFPLFLLLFHLAKHVISTGGEIPGVIIRMPPSHIALSGDLNIEIVSSSFLPLVVQLSRLEGNVAQPLTTFPVYPEAGALKRNLTVAKIHCGYFSRGGQYYVQIKNQPILGPNSTDLSDSQIITRSLDVRWPMPQLVVTPENVKTYPESPVTAILTFPEVVCPPIKGVAPSAIPEFWLELHYCGHSLLNCEESGDETQNKSSHQVLYSEQVRGLPGKSVFILRCELFGLSGHYAIFLRPTNPDPALPRTAAYVKVDWSDQFVFNVHAHSIFPCDTHNGGITVLFQYPSCILADRDRVRLFARLRANVASLAPPTSLEYISEQKITQGQHSLHFECDLFTERYVEYCFVYVSQSISGAVADVREDCVPTLPVSDQERGGWGPWSQWTPCSSTCIGGIRSRYRLCDSPAPRYGAKFCEGPPVETEKCGTSLGSSWECFYSGTISGNDIIAAEIPEVQAEVGPYCRCGCVVHLGQAKPKRFLATSSQSCPGRTFWLIQADDDSVVQFRVEQFYLPCGNQWLKIRDGSSLSSTLLADLTGQPGTSPSIVNSTGPNLLLEFYSDEISIGPQVCGGGFLAEASQIKIIKPNITEIRVAHSISTAIPAVVLKLTAVHIAAIFFLSGLIIATTLLGMQYAFRYRKYHIAEAEDQDSLAASNASLPLATRAQSNSTLLSEVISLTRMRPLNMKSRRNKHSRLRESIDCDQDQEEEVTLAREEEECFSGSTLTLTAPNDTTNTTLPTLANPESDEITPSASLPTSPHTEWRVIRRSSTLSEKDRSNEKDSTQTLTGKGIMRRVSNATLTNGCYSSAASMISTATIRSTNAKATKDKKNRERLLAGPGGSEFSIAVPDNDLEIDYYDYNVANTEAVPGSYLGMDPAFLVWIPPLDETGEILPLEGHECHEMTDIRPRVYIDPGSNKESPEEETLLPKPRRRSISECSSICSSNRKKTKVVYPLVHGLNNSGSNHIDNKYINESEPLKTNKQVTIPLHEFPKKIRRIRQDMEKETKVEKSPSVDSNAIDEIRFADDEDNDLDINEIERSCNVESVT
ncbi:thrombospondin-1 like protein golden goal isoform X3 [Rhynchophorus ferrugineus]|uniref:thrombospondin-1 like protein golden goal isoform X3 n=1 Tax=Rhynchophorus ferrugineus TaxID=354439 RepID=UPI003FCCD907